MIKKLCLYASCLASFPLAAETIGNVEFQFPPSNYEWRLLANQDFFRAPCDLKDQLEGEEGHCEGKPFEIKIFTHREGDALEIFVASNVPKWIFPIEEDEEDEEEETDPAETIQMVLDMGLNQFFPNHKCIINSVVGDEEDGFIEWELHDGFQDQVHGFSRLVLKDSLLVLSYVTTALKTEHNRQLWTEVLLQAKQIN